MTRLVTLFIGVENYRAYDPSGQHDLQGSVADVRAWADLCVRRLGLNAAEAVMMLSPADNGRPGGATAARIEEAIKSLARELDQPGTVGLLVYSGHGTALAGRSSAWNLAICPADVTAGPEGVPEGSISLTQLQAWLGGHRMNLTMVFDCCHDGSAVNRPGARVLPGRSVQRGDQHPLLCRVLEAAAEGEAAYEVEVQGVVRGAFSWAAIQLLDQWNVAGSGPAFTISYQVLMRRTQALLSALGVEQTPQLAGPRALDYRAFLSPPGSAQPTSAQPDRQRWVKELSPDTEGIRVYGLWSTTSPSLTQVGAIFVVGAVNQVQGGRTWAANTEYWYFSSDYLNTLVGTSASPLPLTFTILSEGTVGVRDYQIPPPYDAPSGTTARWTMSSQATWGPSATVTFPSGWFRLADETVNNIQLTNRALCIQVSNSNGVVVNTVTWTLSQAGVNAGGTERLCDASQQVTTTWMNASQTITACKSLEVPQGYVNN